MRHLCIKRSSLRSTVIFAKASATALLECTTYSRDQVLVFEGGKDFVALTTTFRNHTIGVLSGTGNGRCPSGERSCAFVWEVDGGYHRQWEAAKGMVMRPGALEFARAAGTAQPPSHPGPRNGRIIPCLHLTLTLLLFLHSKSSPSRGLIILNRNGIKNWQKPLLPRQTSITVQGAWVYVYGVDMDAFRMQKGEGEHQDTPTRRRGKKTDGESKVEKGATVEGKKTRVALYCHSVNNVAGNEEASRLGEFLTT